MTLKFKIGDIVTCHVKDDMDSGEVFGLTGIVVKVDTGTNQPYYVRFNHPADYEIDWWIQESSIKLVKELSPEEVEKERIERICKKIKYLDDKYQRRMEKKKCQPSLNTNHAPTAEVETTSQDTQTGRLGALGVGTERVVPYTQEFTVETINQLLTEFSYLQRAQPPF